MKFAAVAMMAAILTGCGAGNDTAYAPSAPEVDVATVASESVTLNETFTGRLAAPESVSLRPRVTGYIEQVAFTEGEYVQAGDLLFQIDPRPYEARVRAANAQLRQARSQQALAEKEAQRAGRLLTNHAISQEEYDQRQTASDNTRAGTEAALAELDTSQLDLEYTRVLAPVSGRAGLALVTKGNLARADETMLTTIESVSPLYVYFDSNESASLSSLKLLDDNGQRVPLRIEISGESGFPRQGELDYIANRVDANTGTLRHRAVIDNPQGVLRPGLFARVEMPVSHLTDALLVRRSAVLTNQDRRFVYVVDANNEVVPRQVETGREVDGLLVIRRGLANGDRVVVKGTQKIYAPGMQVTPNKVSMRDVANASEQVAATAP